MGQTLLAAMASGLALAGVLAAGGTAAVRFSRGMPHLGVAAVGAGAAVVGSRLAAWPTPVALVAVALVAAAAGGVAWVVDRRARNVDAPVWPPALLPEVAVLAIGVCLAALLRPSSAIDLPVGPLGGLASTTGAVVAFGIGVAAALATAAVMSTGRRHLLGWILAVVGTACTLAMGAGWLSLRGAAVVPAFGIPDVIGLAVRAAAVGVVGRNGVVQTIAAALVLGVGEALLRSQLSWAETAALPAIAVVAWGLWRTYRGVHQAAAA